MGSQTETNWFNLQQTRETNMMNYQIAAEANAYNLQQQQMQNLWNLERRNEEWAYNDPSAQMERFIKAGINPLWAMSGTDPGRAQPLTSADAKPAEVAQMQAFHADYDPNQLTQIVAASRDLVNALQTSERNDLIRQDVETRRKAQISESTLNNARAANLQAATAGMEVQNRWNLDTFGVRADQETAKLVALRQQAATNKAAQANYEASKDLVREQISRISEDYQLKWKQIHIAERGVAAQETQAAASMQNAETNAGRLDFDKQFQNNWADVTVQKWTNDQLIEFLKAFPNEFKGEISGGASGKIPGLGGADIHGKVGISMKSPNQALLEKAGVKALNWYHSEPDNPQAAEAARLAVEKTDKIDNDIHVPFSPGYDTSNTSVLNPLWQSDW